MMELQAGLLDRAQQFYRRHHTLVVMAVLSLAGIITGTTAVLALYETPAIGTAALICIGAAFAFFCALALVRHRLFALFCVLTPLSGLVWAAPIAAGTDFDAVPFLAYGFGFAAAMFWAENRLLSLLRAGPATTALPAILATFVELVVLAVLWFRGTAAADAALQAVTDTALTVLSATLLLPVAVSYLHFDENFIAEANRAREQRLRWLEWASALAVPRWGLSALGISGILIVLGWYGAQLSLLDAVGTVAVSLALCALVGGLVGAGWREGLAHLLAAGAAFLLFLWAFTVSKGGTQHAVATLQLVGLGSLLALNGFWRVWRHRLRGEVPHQARGRVLEDCGGALAALGGCVCSVLALAQTSAVALLFGVFCAGACGLFLAPALATGLEVLLPRRGNVEELYGRKRRKR